MLLTSRDIAENSPLLMADFRDMLALVYKPTGSYLGIGRTGVRLGKGPVEMVNGLWIVKEDEGLRQSHQNLRVTPEELALEMIK